jgi:hypothetical protein
MGRLAGGQDGSDEQMFGAKQQVSRSGQIDQDQRGTVVLTGNDLNRKFSAAV